MRPLGFEPNKNPEQPTSMTLDNIHSLSAQDMKAVNDFILAQLKSDVVLINQIGAHIIHSGGKRLRPMLVVLAARSRGALHSSLTEASVGGNDFDIGALLRPTGHEAHSAIGLGKEGVIPAATDIFTMPEAGAALAQDDAAGMNGLAAKDLDAKTFGF